MRRTYFIFLLPYYCPVVSVPKPRSSNSTLPWADRFLILTSSPSPPALVFVLLCGGFSSKVKIFQQYTAMGGPFSYLPVPKPRSSNSTLPWADRFLIFPLPHPRHCLSCCACLCVFGGGGGGPVSKPRSSNSTLPWADRFLILTSSPSPPASLSIVQCVQQCHGRTVFLS